MIQPFWKIYRGFFIIYKEKHTTTRLERKKQSEYCYETNLTQKGTYVFPLMLLYFSTLSTIRFSGRIIFC